MKLAIFKHLPNFDTLRNPISFFNILNLSECLKHDIKLKTVPIFFFKRNIGVKCAIFYEFKPFKLQVIWSGLVTMATDTQNHKLR
jgi:hypothetical protein